MFLKKNQNAKKTMTKIELATAFKQKASAAWAPGDVRAALDQWVMMMKKGQPIEIGNMYQRGASFWGTVAGKLITDGTGTYDYFEHFLDGKSALEISIDTQNIHIHGRWGKISGEYTFNYTDDQGQRHVFPARYSFTFERLQSGGFEILSHHSSDNPQKPPFVQPKPSKKKSILNKI